MKPNTETWEYIVLDADPLSHRLGSLAASDLDGDGRMEIVVGGYGAAGQKEKGSLMWYRPSTFEKGLVAKGGFSTGSAVADLDGDGKMEIVTGEDSDDPSMRRLFLFSMGASIAEWERFTIDERGPGLVHDVVAADIDGDGATEIVANAVGGATPGVFLYRRPGGGPTKQWRRVEIQTGFSGEGLAVADLDGDAVAEVISGVAWYGAGADPFDSPWSRHIFAADFREMCRNVAVDVTGSGRDDIVAVESSYPDGRLSWFENRLVEDPRQPFVEHVIDTGIKDGHSLSAWRDAKAGSVHIFVGEMSEGGSGGQFNFDARLLLYSSPDNGATWSRAVISVGQGTHGAAAIDIDGDGEIEIVGKDANGAVVHMWKRTDNPSVIGSYRHRFVDWDKPYTSTDILVVDVDGDGNEDIVTGAFWYRSPQWERFEIPGVYQAILAYDVDRDGRPEIIATKRKPGAKGWYDGLSSEIVWVKPLDPVKGAWIEHRIGTGSGDWPHGSVAGELLPNGARALVVGYHSAGDEGHRPEIFEIPADPTKPWPMRVLSDINYGEELLASDVNGDGRLDLVGGYFWLENDGAGKFADHIIADARISLPDDTDTTFREPGRVVLMDVNQDGIMDIIAGEESLDYPKRRIPRGHLVWLEPSDQTKTRRWQRHIIDKIRCPHSVGVADLDGDGQMEIIAGEHDPFLPYRSRSRLFVYKCIDSHGCVWKRWTLDGRFEHHDGTKVIKLSSGRLGIVSIAWNEGRYVHLWEPGPQPA